MLNTGTASNTVELESSCGRRNVWCSGEMLRDHTCLLYTSFEEIKTSEHGISPKFHWSTRPGTMFRPHAAVSCYNPNKSGSKFSVKFVFISFAIHCDS